jgi:hypothetical protein
MNSANDPSAEIQIIEPGEVLPAGDRSEYDTQIVTAKRFPRSIDKFREEMRSLAVRDRETAEACVYATRRGGKTIEGPSIRFAELLAYAWGNLRVDARPAEVEDSHIINEATCFDCERNVAWRQRTKRRITNRHGERYNEDMIGTATNANTSIVARNVVLRVIPKPVWKPIYDEVKAVAIGTEETFIQRRDVVIAWFQKAASVNEDRLCEWLERDGVDDIKPKDLLLLRSAAERIRDGESATKVLGREQPDETKADELDAALEEPKPEADYDISDIPE